MTADHIIPADLMQASVAELAAEVVRLRAALDRTLAGEAEAIEGQARALVKIVDLKARAEAAEAETLAQARLLGMSGERELALRAKLEAAEAKVARLVGLLTVTHLRLEEVHFHDNHDKSDPGYPAAIRHILDKNRAALREIGGGNV